MTHWKEHKFPNYNRESSGAMMHLSLDPGGSKVSWDSFRPFRGRLGAVVLHNRNISEPSRIQDDANELKECGDCQKQHWKRNLRWIRVVLHITFTWQSWLLRQELPLCICKAQHMKLGFTYLQITPWNFEKKSCYDTKLKSLRTAGYRHTWPQTTIKPN